MKPWLGSTRRIKTRVIKTTEKEPEWKTRVWTLERKRKALKWLN